ncbi:hypothetical protein JRG18_11445 [Kocuria palustris]|uniref:hypothetical protein n=1 Tax=Kocuria palustris TaxID=71999 RepID=UPI00045E8FFB|nr:hypothetical protein [Kocuria palustris]MBN6753499.1 hypothetical protein [Kocuria palustris]MBN6759076.1 hypothetical protein [Kocuria palustris]MBN6763589.1 hypothetical protein [Kocuria palustris]MBN6783004.1 hypothetical protein [Kocuria palustris]MBN6799522.1 hypothetical protein [Kocuria palustris]
MSIEHRLTVKPHVWHHDDGQTETGYMLRRGGGFLFLDEMAAYHVCCKLADLIDAANNEAQQETDQ